VAQALYLRACGGLGIVGDVGRRRRGHAQRPVARLLLPARPRPTTGEPLAVDAPRTHDADVFDSDSPDEAVLPVTVAEVLVEVVLVWLRGVVAALAGRGIGGEQGGARAEGEDHVALQPDGEAGVGAGGEVDGTAAGGGRGVDGLVDGVGVDGGAVSAGSERADVIGGGAGLRAA